MVKIMFVGSDADDADNPAFCNMFGYSFPLGEEMDAELTEAQIAKLRGNSHFMIDEAPPKKRRSKASELGNGADAGGAA